MIFIPPAFARRQSASPSPYGVDAPVCPCESVIIAVCMVSSVMQLHYCELKLSVYRHTVVGVL